jgi:tetratricopeptide (TPR) repeat protein
MKFKPFYLLAIAAALTLVVGCGHKQRVQELLKDGADAQENEDYDQAIEDFSGVIKLDPKSEEAYLQRGNILAITGEFAKAIADLDEAIRLDPHKTFAYEIRGHAYFGNDQLEKAITDYNVVLKAEPENAGVLKMRGKAFYWRHDYPNALTDLTKALKFETNDAEIFDDRGDLFFREKNFDLALNDFNDALRIDPEDATGLFGRGYIYYKNNRFPEAAHDFEMVIRLKPKTVRAYNELAWLLATCPNAQARDGKKAVELATKACSLSKWKKYAYVDTLAAAYAEAGDFEQAVKYQKQAAAMDGIPEDNRTNVLNRIDLYRQHKPYRTSNGDYD